MKKEIKAEENSRIALSYIVGSTGHFTTATNVCRVDL